MIRFMIRIDLQDAEADEYDHIHARLESAGLTKILEPRRNARYFLPRGQYIYSSNDAGDDAMSVMSNIKALVGETDRKLSVIVCQFSWSAWSGLLRAEDDDEDHD